MLTRLGIYDLFSYMLPGAMYLGATITALKVFPIGITVPFSSFTPSVLALFVAVSYLIGIMMAPIKWTPWDRLLPKVDFNSELNDLQQTYPEISLHIKHNQWPVLQANMGLENFDASLAVDKLRATHIMLRNVSLALCVYFILALFYIVGHWDSIFGWIGAFIALSCSALAAKASRMFSSWTFRYTVELMIARVIDPSDFVKKKE